MVAVPQGCSYPHIAGKDLPKHRKHASSIVSDSPEDSKQHWEGELVIVSVPRIQFDVEKHVF